MAIEQFSKSDKSERRSASDTGADGGARPWRDLVVDISWLWNGVERGTEVNLVRRELDRSMTAEENESFWQKCNEVAGPGREPDWEEHLKTINEARQGGLPDD